MQVLEGITQGSQQWLAVRTQYFTASEAPAMMGASKYQTRSELLHQKATGLTPDVDRNKQALFDRGHAAEAAARTILEEQTGEEFFPITAVSDTGKLLASVDGITMGDDVLFEHKLWSKPLAAQVRIGKLEPHYFWQLEHQLLVTGAKKVIFVCSDGTRDNWVQMEYLTVPGRREQLIAAWKQFNTDLAAYVPEPKAAPVIAAPQETLPAVSVRVDGQLAIVSNLPAFGAALQAFIAKIPTEPSTDQEFADTEAACKALKRAEDALEAAESNALAQLADVDTLRRLVADYRALARTTRLQREKLVTLRKDQLRTEIVTTAQAAARAHTDALNKRLGGNYMPTVPADFAGAIKGKKSLDSMRDAVADVLAQFKIASIEVQDRIIDNLAALRDRQELAFLFPDVLALVQKQPDDLRSIITARTAEHNAKEQERIEATRERIRAEEQAKAESAPTPKPIAAAQGGQDEFDNWRQGGVSAAANVVPMRQNQPAAPATLPNLTLGAIGTRMGFNLSAEFLKNLGFEATKVKASCLYQESDFPLMCMRLTAHIQGVQTRRAV